MKKAFLTLVLTGVLTITLLAQAPRAFKYQAVARDRAGQVLSNQNVSLQISILQSGNSGPEIYREHQSVTTSEFGLINLQVGSGRTILGNMSEIDWGSGSHYLRIEMDPSGGTDFELVGVSELLSVPYALYAEKSGSGERGNDYDWEITGGHVVTGHGGSYPSGNVGIGNNAPGTLLYVAKNMGEPTITIRNLGGGGGATYSMVDDFSGANWKFKATTYGGFKIRDQANALDVITIEANSAANALYFLTGGNIGMGTTTPSTRLHLFQNTATTTPQLLINNANATGDAALRFFNPPANISLGIDNNDNQCFKITNTNQLTGTLYGDGNTMMRIHSTSANNGIVDFNHQSRARAFMPANFPLGMPGPPLFYYWDWYGRPWLPIPFQVIAPQPAFDEHSEFIIMVPPPVPPIPPPPPGFLTSFFMPKEEGYYQVNARFEIPIDSSGWIWELIPEGGFVYDRGSDGSRLMTPPWPIFLSIGIFLNGQLYAQGNNFQLNSEYQVFYPGMMEPAHEFSAFWFMNAPNVSDVVYCNGQNDYVEICVFLVGLAGPGQWWVPFPVFVKGDPHGVFTYVSIHKVS